MAYLTYFTCIISLLYVNLGVIRNFLFHRVSPKRDVLWDPMDVKLFEKSIQYISKNYTIVSLEELALSPALYPKTNYATILFDDGYKDNLDYAADILHKYKCSASFYVVTDCIQTNTLTWTHQLEHLFQNTTVSTLDLDFEFLPNDLKVKKLNTPQERIHYISRLKPYLKTISHQNRNAVLDRIRNTFNDVELPQLMMNWDDLKQLKNAGHYIGSHTITHAMLGTMTDESEIKNELLLSAKTIEQKLGHFPLSISYPVGSYNNTTKIISKEVGYKLGLAVNQTVYNPQKNDLFEIPRIELYNEPWWKTRMRITTSLETIKKIIRYK